MIEHKHIIIRTEVDWFFGKKDQEQFIIWIRDLVSKLNMNLLSGPHTVYVDSKLELKGWTGVCIIETSHIAIHVWDDRITPLVQLDVYTCGSLDPKVVFDHLKIFNPIKKIEFLLLDRETNITEIKYC